MIVFTKSTLRAYWQNNAQARTPLQEWHTRVSAKSVAWRSFADVRRDFPSVDRVGDCYVFNIGGNNYRLIAQINFDYATVFVKKIMTHAEYDKNNWQDECDC